MTDALLHIASIITVLVLVGDKIIQRKHYRKALELYVESALNLETLKQEYEKVFTELADQKIEKNDGFVKFISDSRDWAFQYIEDVQQALEDFDKKISPTLEYYSTFGSTIDGLHVDLTKQVSEAYEELKRVLPKQ
jgi:hypothetical protein